MEERIEYLMQRYLDRNESKEELDELMDIIASDKYRDLIEAKLGKDLQDSLASSSFGDAHSPRIKAFNKYSFQRSWIQIAAVISVVITVVFVKQYITQDNQKSDTQAVLMTTVKAESGVKKVMLDDGSIVWLKGESSLTYPENFDRTLREVTLKGEALFEVAKDASRPFIIDCGSLTTKVLGTSFNIKSDPDNTEIIVLTGKVSVTPKGDRHTVYVHPNEKIIYSEKNRMVTKTNSPKLEQIASVEKTEYNMTFNDVSVDEVARKIEGKFSVKVQFSEEQMKNCLITADFTDQSLEATMRMISKSLDFTYEYRDNVIMIRGTGCEP